MLNSKKAESENWTADTFAFYIIFCILATITMLVFVFLVNGFFSDYSRTPAGLEKAILLDRFPSSPQCLAAQDPLLEMTAPLVLDSARLSSETLRECYFGMTSRHRAFQFSLLAEGRPLVQASTPNWDASLGIIQREPSQSALVLSDTIPSTGQISIGVQHDGK